MSNSTRVVNVLRKLGRLCGWLALLLLLLTVVSGYGITEFRLVTGLTFGLLNKVLSFRLHHYTELPMIALLSIHVAIALWARRRRPQQIGVEK